jgi:RecA/RadA recombinase
VSRRLINKVSVRLVPVSALKEEDEPPMDTGAIAAALTVLLAKDAASAMAGEIGKDTLAALKQAVVSLRKKLSTEPTAKAAVEQLAAHPKDQANQDRLTKLIEARLAEDPEFAKDLYGPNSPIRVFLDALSMAYEEALAQLPSPKEAEVEYFRGELQAFIQQLEALGKQRPSVGRISGKREPLQSLTSSLSQQLRGRLTDQLEALERQHDTGTDVTGVPTGFPALDRLTHGLQPGNLIIVAGRSAVGKTTFAVDLARNAAIRAQVPTVLFSLDMTGNEMVQRVLCAEASINMQRMLSGRMQEADWLRLTMLLPRLVEAELAIDDTALVTSEELRATCRRLLSRDPDRLGLVVIDDLYGIEPARRLGDDERERLEVARLLKRIARELRVPVVAISRVTRAGRAWERFDLTRPPTLHDLSSAEVEIADLVLLLHRDDLDDLSSSRRGEADVILAKHRSGQTETVTIVFQPQYARFAPLADPNL